MRALVTGAAGFVGSHLMEYLFRNTDWHITGTHRWNESLDNLEELRDWINSGYRIQLVEMDLDDAASVMAVMRWKPHYIFHLAAQSYVQASFVYPSKTLQTNAIGTLNMLEAVRAECPDAWFHNCSSSEVYGKIPEEYGRVDESCPLSPASPYSISKVAADMLGRFYAKAYGLKVVTTRMFTHTGPRRGDVFMESSFAKQIAMIDEAMLLPPIKVGNLHSVRTIADVRDAVRAYHMLLTVNPIAGEVYNIGGSYTCTAGQVLCALLDCAGHGYGHVIDPTRLRPLDANHQIPDCSKFTAHTGWKPEIPFKQTMSDLLVYWRERVKHEVCIQR